MRQRIKWISKANSKSADWICEIILKIFLHLCKGLHQLMMKVVIKQ